MQLTTIAEPENTQLLFQRVEKLEKDNRNLKRTLLTMSVLFLALFTVAQVRPVAKVIEAEKFVLKDSSGKERAFLGIGALGAELKLTDVNAQRGAGYTSIGPAHISMYYTTGADKDSSASMGPAGISFRTRDKTEEQTTKMFASGPTIELQDRQGFRTTIGTTDLETIKTGESHKTSAASIVIFDKEQKVIWKAPLP